jgi:hypothetical protein
MNGDRKYCHLVVARSSFLFFYCSNNSLVHVAIIFILTSSPKSLGRNKNMDVGIWMLDKDVNRWGIELTMEMLHIEWCFQFKKWMDLDNVKYAHVVNFKAYKDDL